MVACMLRSCAAAATPWAWLPEENATTPPPRAACGIEDSLLKAFFFQAEDGIRDIGVTGVQTCALPISSLPRKCNSAAPGTRRRRSRCFNRGRLVDQRLSPTE